MGERGLVGALFAGVAVIAVSLLGSWLRPRGLAAPPAPPVLGRVAGEVDAGPDARFAGIAKSSASDRARRREREEMAAWTARLGGSVPPFARTVVVHPFVGPVPDTDAEEGPPWHLVLETSGELTVGRRFRASRPSVPPGQPPAAARRALHLAVPFAGEMPMNRREVLRGLCRHLRRRMPSGDATTITLADRVPGATVDEVPGFPRDLLERGENREEK